MAAPEMQNAPIAGESRQPPANPKAARRAAHAADREDWREFDWLDKVFDALMMVVIAALLATTIAARLDNEAAFGVSFIVLIVAMVGMVGLLFPISWFYVKGSRRWRRRQVAERPRREGDHQDA